MPLSESNTNTENPVNPWFYIRWYSWIRAKTQNGITWLFPNQPDYPANEAGELMRRTMAQKSWFDTLSSTWVEQPILIKSLSVVGVLLIFGLMGWLLAAPIILPLTALFVCIVSHLLLVTHEHQRLERVRILSTEVLSLTADLVVSKQLLDEATTNVSLVVSDLNTQSQCIIVEEVQYSTSVLLAAPKKAYLELEQVADHLTSLDQAITGSTLKVKALGEATSQFTDSVSGIQNSQKIYSDAAARFSLFVTEPTATKIPEQETNSEASINALNAELDENDVLIEEMKRVMTLSN